MGDRAERGSNRLIDETSPYLLQHAHNPVDWFPWGNEALTKAAVEDKPIFLSIGYAACHWCHVMERESFEDEATASFMNERFVAIKVDREERPDLDGIYMDAAQALTGQGGWPLSVFLTPTGEPFYAGTYFPPEPRHGMPAFIDVLHGVADAWRDRRDDVVGQADRLARAIARATEVAGGATAAGDAELDPGILDVATSTLRASFDPRWGGFGRAPKFPQPMTIEFLLRRAIRGSLGALEMVTVTLDRMADGGIRDHAGGGFARYSTDERWHVPHFEKMLYDNAQLLQLYTRAWQVTGRDRYRAVATDTAAYLLREMQQPEGGFSSSGDADSEGVEGKFFTWTWHELAAIVGEPVARALGATPEGNWASEAGATNVLWRPKPIETVATELGVDAGALATQVDDGRRALFRARERRARPATDDKVLAAWNGLTIGALAEAGRAFSEPEYIEAATRAARFVLEHLRRADGRLLRSWRAGVAGVPGFADDYALMASACLTLYETTFDVAWFEHALTLAREMRRLFADPDGRGFFQTGSDSDALVVRPRDLYDNATPGGSSAAADVLLRLARFTGDAAFEREAVWAIRLVADALGRAPTAFGQALCALDRLAGPHREVAIVGAVDADDTRALAAEAGARRFLPNLVLAVGAPGDERAVSAVPLLRDRPTMNGAATAYVCEGFVCRLPVTEPDALARQLDDAFGG